MQENPETLNTQAIELAAHGEYPEAIACFKRAITMQKENYLLWYNLGITYRDAGNLSGSKQALVKAYELSEMDEEVLESLSLVCYAMNEFSEAFEYCAQALELNSENAHIWNNVGVLYFSQGIYDQACEAFEHAVTIDPHYYDALYNLRDTYSQLGNETGAADCSARLKKLSAGGSFYA